MSFPNKPRLTDEQPALFTASNEIYHYNHGTLAERLDLAWDTFMSPDKRVTKEMKKNALMFLLYALNPELPEDGKALIKQLASLMEDRRKHRENNPDYIPGRGALHLPFDPATVVPEKTEQSGESDNESIQAAMDSQELLDTSNRYKVEDVNSAIHYYNSKERARYHVVIHNGEFKQNGERFSTENMISHKKPGFAAYTLNSNGELSVFDHKGGEDKIAHSTMNAGAPVVSAGELEIKNGKLLSITTHSGHYRPTLFNVYRTLEYLKQQGVDVSNVVVLTSKNPSEKIPAMESRVRNDELFTNAYGGDCLYETSAIKIHSTITELLDQSIASIRARLTDYNRPSLVTILLGIKDSLINSNLTEQRHNLATELDNAAITFQEEISNNPSLNEVEKAQEKFKSAIEDIERRNKQLSVAHDKRETNGRLHAQIQKCKDQIESTHNAGIAGYKNTN